LLVPLAKLLGPEFDLRCTSGLRMDGDIGEELNITHLGYLSEHKLIEEYRQCDAVISLSRYEGFGYTVLEGMACGKPVLGFACPGVKELVLDQVTGLLTKTDDIKKLAEMCIYLAGNSAVRERLGAAGRQHALQHYDMRESVRKYVSVYQNVLQSTRVKSV
jgi:alpha-maltose-1-phosphate synthase